MKRVSVLTLLLAAPQLGGASDVYTLDASTLKKSLQDLTKEVEDLEDRQIITEEKKETLKKRQQTLEAENQQLKVADQSTLKAGSMPGSHLIPGTKTSLNIHGYIKLDVIHESRIPDGDLATATPNNFTNVPLQGTTTYKRGGQTQMFLKETRIDLDTNTPTDFGSVFSRIETDFYGSGVVPRLRIAYVKVTTAKHEVLTGQDWTLLADGFAGAGAETLDFGGIAGLPGNREAQLRYTFNPRGPVSFAASLENTDTTYYAYDTSTSLSTNISKTYASTDGNLKTQGSSGLQIDRVPDVVLRTNIGHADRGASLRVITTEEHITGASLAKNAKRGYGIAHAGYYTFTNKDRATYDITYGTGLGGWMTGGSGAALDVANKQLFLQRTLGLAVSYKHIWNEMWRSTLGLGYLRIYNRDFMKTLQTNRWVRDFHINLIAEPVKHVHVGIEYGLGQRRVEALPATTSATKPMGTDHRLQFSIKYAYNPSTF